MYIIVTEKSQFLWRRAIELLCLREQEVDLVQKI